MISPDYGLDSVVRASLLIFLWEHILHLDLQPVKDRFQLVECNVVFTPFDPVESSMRNANFLGEIRVRKASPSLSQIPRKLAVQVSLHQPTLTKSASRMRDDF